MFCTLTPYFNFYDAVIEWIMISNNVVLVNMFNPILVLVVYMFIVLL